MDKQMRPEGATILRFPVRDAGRLAERQKPADKPTPPDTSFDIDAWYHQNAVDETGERAKH